MVPDDLLRWCDRTPSITAVGQTGGGKVAKVETAAQELKRLDREWYEAVVRGDAAALGRLASDDYVFSDGADEKTAKPEEVATLKPLAFDFKPASVMTSEVEARAEGERAEVTGRATFKGRLGEADVVRRYWYTRTFARRDGRWRIIADRFIALSRDAR